MGRRSIWAANKGIARRTSKDASDSLIQESPWTHEEQTLIAVYQLQLELVNVNPADIHWQARIHMRHVKRHTKTRAGKRQGDRDVLAPLLEQQLPALPDSTAR